MFLSGVILWQGPREDCAGGGVESLMKADRAHVPVMGVVEIVEGSVASFTLLWRCTAQLGPGL